MMELIEGEFGVMSVKEFARAYRMSAGGVYCLLASGQLRASKVGGRTLIMFEDIRRWQQSLPRYETRKGSAVARAQKQAENEMLDGVVKYLDEALAEFQARETH